MRNGKDGTGWAAWQRRTEAESLSRRRSGHATVMLEEGRLKTRLTTSAMRIAQLMEGDFGGDRKPVKGDQYRLETTRYEDAWKTSKVRSVTSKAKEGAVKANEPLHASSEEQRLRLARFRVLER